MIIPLEIWYQILNYLNLKSQINLILTHIYLRDNLWITDLYNIDEKLLIKLDDQILGHKMFSHVTRLNARDNKKITNVSLMTNLKILYACGNCGINQSGINGLNLVELCTSDNSKITDVKLLACNQLSAGAVSFMTNLEILYAYGNCGIDQTGINRLNLVELSASGNNKINKF